MFRRTLPVNTELPADGSRTRLPVDKFNFPSADVEVGEKVRAQWKGFGYKGPLFHGSIAALHDDGTFHVVFDDGDCDLHCKAKYITRENGAGMPRNPGACGCVPQHAMSVLAHRMELCSKNAPGAY
jgi:hypothetical protein